MKQLWQEQAALLGGPDLLQVLLEIRDGQQRLMERVEQTEGAIERVLSGFPADDVEGHRRYHESVIEWRELRNKLVRDLLMKAAQATFMGALGFLALAAWKAFQISVTR